MIVWIASYPKSGNTWMRAFLSSYFMTENGIFDVKKLNAIPNYPQQSFFGDEIIPKGEIFKFWESSQKKIIETKKIKFLKTHNAMCKIDGNSFTNKQNTLGAIYIIRDPRNVVTSLAHHYQINITEALQFMQNEKKAIFINENGSYNGFVPLLSWNLHSESWLNNKAFPVLLIRYEDLYSETFYTFKKVINFIQQLTRTKDNFNKEKAKKSIRSCDFEKLKKLEKEVGFFEAMKKRDSEEKIKFFNLGKENNFKKILDKKIIEEINLKYSSELIKFQYEQ